VLPACSLLSSLPVSGVGVLGLANLLLLFACFCVVSRLERLDNFPKLRRLKWILASNNAISRIQDNLVNTLPNLKVLVLSNNRISLLSEISKLKGLKYVAERALAQRQFATRSAADRWLLTHSSYSSLTRSLFMNRSLTTGSSSCST
jgi:Leucine-rich repeat (LRR) protein